MDFDRGDWSTSAVHLYWGLMKMSCRAWLHLYCFLVTRKVYRTSFYLIRSNYMKCFHSWPMYFIPIFIFTPYKRPISAIATKNLEIKEIINKHSTETTSPTQSFLGNTNPHLAKSIPTFSVNFHSIFVQLNPSLNDNPHLNFKTGADPLLKLDEFLSSCNEYCHRFMKARYYSISATWQKTH